MEDAAKGTVEKETIPRKAYVNADQNGSFVFPALRSTFSKAIHFVLKPTQPKIPLENLSLSSKDNTAFTICLLISR